MRRLFPQCRNVCRMVWSFLNSLQFCRYYHRLHNYGSPLRSDLRPSSLRFPFAQVGCDLINPEYVWSPSNSPCNHLPMERLLTALHSSILYMITSHMICWLFICILRFHFEPMHIVSDMFRHFGGRDPISIFRNICMYFIQTSVFGRCLLFEVPIPHCCMLVWVVQAFYILSYFELLIAIET